MSESFQFQLRSEKQQTIRINKLKRNIKQNSTNKLGLTCHTRLGLGLGCGWVGVGMGLSCGWSELWIFLEKFKHLELGGWVAGYYGL